MKTFEKTIERPTWNDEMLEELSENFAQKILKWSKTQDEQDWWTYKECLDACRKVFEYSFVDDNGYQLAKEFENEGFMPNLEFVDILDGVSSEVYQIKQKHIKKWVEMNDIQLNFKKGQKVIAKIRAKGEIECEIMDEYPEKAQYVVWFEGLGYIRGKGGRIINQEDIIKVV